MGYLPVDGSPLVVYLAPWWCTLPPGGVLDPLVYWTRWCTGPVSVLAVMDPLVYWPSWTRWCTGPLVYLPLVYLPLVYLPLPNSLLPNSLLPNSSY